MNNQYDYIIAGTGCAGLSLAVALSDAGLTRGKKILLIDREQKIKHDRTWCFWEKEDGRFDEIVFRKWNAVNFHGLDYSECL
ncbi:MAG: lycopene cyclase family protein, partial [Chitinophagaceae bacterium]